MTLLLFASGVAGQVVPAKTWFAPSQPIVFENVGDAPLELVLTTFQGDRVPLRPDAAADAAVVGPGDSLALTDAYSDPAVGTYLLYPVPPGGATTEYRSPAYVVGVRGDDRDDAPGGPVVTKIEPLRYAVLDTEAGSMTAAFYYDSAPDTVANFLRLAEGGFYDGLAFHRVVPGFVVQAGDPVGDGTGGPGYRVDAEFNARPFTPGVLGMAREADPVEAQGALPRDRWRDSAGSQFFVALDYEQTRRLDGRYTAFGRVVDGLDVVERIAGGEVADEATGRPAAPVVIRSVEVRLAEPGGDDPYSLLARADAALLESPTTRPDEGE